MSNSGAMMAVRHLVGRVFFLACLCQVAVAADVQPPGSVHNIPYKLVEKSSAAPNLADSTNAGKFLQSGFSYYKAGDYTGAVAQLKQAVSLEPTNFEANLRLGYSHYSLEHYADAAVALGTAVQCKPNDSEAHCGLGDALYALKRYDEAAAAYRRTLALETNQFRALMGLGNCQFCRKDFQGALESYRQCTLTEPTNYLAHLWLGHSLVQLDRVDQAAVAFGQAVSLFPHDYEANLGRGMTLLRLGRIREATSSFEQAMQSRPHARFPRWGLFLTYLATGQVGKISGLHLGILPAVSILLIALYVPAVILLFRKSLTLGTKPSPSMGFSLAWCGITIIGQTVIILLISFLSSWSTPQALGLGVGLATVPLIGAALLGFARQPWGKPFSWPPRMPGGKLFLIACIALGAALLFDRSYTWLVERITGRPLPEQMIVSWLGAGPHSHWLTFLGVALLAPAGEEILFRGLLFGAIARWLSGPWTIVVTASLFSVMHLQPIYFVPIFAIGLVLGWARQKSEGLALPILLHGANNCGALIIAMHH